MSVPPLQDVPLVTRLLKTVDRLRLTIVSRCSEVSALEVAEEAHVTTKEGVPLVLPFDPERRLIPRLLRKLRRGRFLRRCPATMDEYAPLRPEAVRYFLDRLHTVHIDEWKEGVTAVWALGRLTRDDPMRTEATELLCRFVESRGDSGACSYDKRVMKRWLAIWRNLFGGVMVWGAAMLLAGHEGFVRPSLPTLVICAALIGFYTFVLSLPATVLSFLVGLPLDVERMDRIRSMAVLTLGRWREPYHMDMLMRKCGGEAGARVRRAAEIAVHELLPLLTADEGAEHATDFVPNLCRSLERKERRILGHTVWEETLEIRMLEALGKVGDGRALPTVERIARRGRTTQLQELAQSILPILHARNRLANDPNQLLRGAVQPDTAPNTLLRPAHHTATPPDQLLRPQIPANSDSIPVQRHGS